MINRSQSLIICKQRLLRLYKFLRFSILIIQKYLTSIIQILVLLRSHILLDNKSIIIISINIIISISVDDICVSFFGYTCGCESFVVVGVFFSVFLEFIVWFLYFGVLLQFRESKESFKTLIIFKSHNHYYQEKDNYYENGSIQNERIIV